MLPKATVSTNKIIRGLVANPVQIRVLLEPLKVRISQVCKQDDAIHFIERCPFPTIPTMFVQELVVSLSIVVVVDRKFVTN